MLWNCKSLGKNKPSLYNYLAECPQHIIVLCETWLKKEYLISTPDYVSKHICRNDGYGGLSVLIKKNCPVEWIKMENLGNPHIHFIIFKCYNITIIAGYIPPQVHVNLQSWRNLVRNVVEPFIIIGDFNALHTCFGSFSINNNGKSLEEFVDEMNLTVLNDGHPTFFALPGRRSNVLDLVICSPTISQLIQCQTAEDTLGSDHFPVLSQLQIVGRPYCHTWDTNGRYNMNKCDWEKFNDHIENIFDANYINSYEDFINGIREAVTSSAPLRTENLLSSNRWYPWWDQQCTKIVRLRQLAIRQYKRNLSQTNYLIAKRYIAIAKRTLVKKKKEAFREFCKKLSGDSSLSEVWRTVRIFGGNVPTVQKLVQGDWKGSFLEQLSPAYVRSKREVDMIAVQEEEHDLVEEITEQEILNALDTTSDTSPGSDKVKFSVLKRLPEVAIKYLKYLYNSILNGHQIPEDWKRVVVVPIPKPGRDHTSVEGYRPISLLNCTRKIMEKIILNRMEWWIERRSALDPFQFGFRKRRGTAQCLFALVGEIQESFLSGNVAVAVFADIKGAYDNVDIPILLDLVRAKEIPSKIILLLQQLFSVKILSIKNELETLGTRQSYTGIPQGSPMSPLLFNIYISSLNEVLKDTGVKAIIYADDVVLLAKATSAKGAIQNINKALLTFSKYLTFRKLTLATNKTKAIVFSRRRKVETIPNIIFQKCTIEVVNSFKYLGVVVNSKLSWNEHINQVCQTAQKAMNILRSLSSVRWGCCPRILLSLYRALIRSRLEYCTWLFAPFPKYLMGKMEKIQYQAIRCAIGALRSSPTNALLVEASEVPIQFRLIYLCKKFIIKNHALRPHPIATLILRLHVSLEKKKRNAGIPMIIMCYRQVASLISSIRRVENYDIFTQHYKCRSFRPDVSTDFGKEFNCKVLRDIAPLELYFREWTQKRWSDAVFIYTDGSVKEADKITSFGIYISDILNVCGKLREGTSIYVAELFAVWWAVNLVTERNIKKAVIFTDSLSVLTALQSVHKNTGNNHYLIDKIREQLWVLSSNQFEVHVSWIPGHTGIKGNEKADVLAAAGAAGSLYNHSLDATELFRILKVDVLKSWQDDWNSSMNVKGKRTYLIKPDVSSAPWFTKGNFDSKLFCTSITRLRIGHGLFPEHMFRMGLLETPLCNCGEVGTLEHIFFNCADLNNIRISFLKSLSKAGYQPPFNLVSILATGSLTIYKLLFRYLCECKIIL